MRRFLVCSVLVLCPAIAVAGYTTRPTHDAIRSPNAGKSSDGAIERPERPVRPTHPVPVPSPIHRLIARALEMLDVPKP